MRAIICTLTILGCYTMTRFNDLPVVRKVVVSFIALWIVACVAMYWSMYNSSRAMITIFLVAAGVPIAAMCVLFMVALHFDRTMPPREPKRRNKASGRGERN